MSAVSGDQNQERQGQDARGQKEDDHGNVTSILVEAEYAKQYREKQRERNRKYYARKKAEEADRVTHSVQMPGCCSLEDMADLTSEKDTALHS